MRRSAVSRPGRGDRAEPVPGVSAAGADPRGSGDGGSAATGPTPPCCTGYSNLTLRCTASVGLSMSKAISLPDNGFLAGAVDLPIRYDVKVGQVVTLTTPHRRSNQAFGLVGLVGRAGRHRDLHQRIGGRPGYSYQRLGRQHVSGPRFAVGGGSRRRCARTHDGSPRGTWRTPMPPAVDRLAATSSWGCSGRSSGSMVVLGAILAAGDHVRDACRQHRRAHQRTRDVACGRSADAAGGRHDRDREPGSRPPSGIPIGVARRPVGRQSVPRGRSAATCSRLPPRPSAGGSLPAAAVGRPYWRPPTLSQWPAVRAVRRLDIARVVREAYSRRRRQMRSSRSRQRL